MRQNGNLNGINLKKLIVLFIAVCASIGAWGQTFEFQYKLKFKFDLTNEELILEDIGNDKIDVWKTKKMLDKNYKTTIIFIHTEQMTFAFYDEMFVFTGGGDAPNDCMKWDALKSTFCNNSDELVGYNFNQIIKAIDEKGQKMLDKIKSSDLDDHILRFATGAGENLNKLAYNYLNPNAINKFANMLLKDSEDKRFPERERLRLISEAMELYEKAMAMGNEEAKKSYNFYKEELKKDKNTTTTPSTPKNEIIFPPSGKIEKVWLEHNVYKNGEYGMNIHVHLTIDNMKGKEIICAPDFYKNNDEKIVIEGTVKRFTPTYDNSEYEDLIIFASYRASGFQSLPRGTSNLKVRCQFLSQGYGEIMLSDYAYFTYTK